MLSFFYSMESFVSYVTIIASCVHIFTYTVQYNSRYVIHEELVSSVVLYC